MPRFNTVIFDCDSTLSAIEGIEELAVTHRAEIVAMTEAAMRGEVSLEDVYATRLQLVQPTRSQVAALGRRYVETLVPDAREVCAALRHAGVEVRVISGGLRPAVLYLARALGLSEEAVAAVDVYFDDGGRYCGFDVGSPLARAGGKRQVIERWSPTLCGPVMLVGDGATDLEGAPLVDLFVAFTGVVERPKVVAQADIVVRSQSLAPIVPLAFGGTPPADRSARTIFEKGMLLLDPQDRVFSINRNPTAAMQHPTPGTTDSAGSALTAGTFGRFFLPGPTEVRPEIAEAQLRPMIGHRGQAMEELLAAIQPGLQYVFRTQRPVYISTSSATGLMEAAVRNGARQRVLCLVNGAFSERFHRIARACGLDAHPLEVALGDGHTPEMLEAALRRGDYDAVTVVHSETSTGVLNPVADLARVAHAAGDVLLLVDSVTGVAGAQVESDTWMLDFVLTGSQKSLALPPGLAFGVAQESVLRRAEAKLDRGIYFDFMEFERAVHKHQTPNTPAISLLYALEAQLERIREETIEMRWERHLAMARRTWAWADEMRDRGVAVEVLAPIGFRSPTVTCLRLPTGRTGARVTAALEARGYTVASGYGALKDSTIRIGHMGDHTVDELEVLLNELSEVLTA